MVSIGIQYWESFMNNIAVSKYFPGKGIIGKQHVIYESMHKSVVMNGNIVRRVVGVCDYVLRHAN